LYQTYNAVPGKVRFEWIGESWELFKAQWSTWVLSGLIFGAIYIAVVLAVAVPLGLWDQWRYLVSHPATGGGFPSSSSAPSSDPLAQLLYDAVGWAVTAFFYGGLFKMANKQVRGEPIAVGDLFSGGSTFLPMLGFVIVFNILIIFGLMCFCIGMAVVYALFWPVFALIADGVSFGNAFSRSFEGMKQDWLMATLYVIVFGLVILASAIPLGLGLLITYPMNYLSTALAYRDMIGMTGPSGGYPGPGAFYPGPTPPGMWPPPPQRMPGQIPPTPPLPPAQMPPGPVPPNPIDQNPVNPNPINPNPPAANPPDSTPPTSS